ncbi:hypothetical protein [Streptomyces sp. NPDC055060]
MRSRTARRGARRGHGVLRLIERLVRLAVADVATVTVVDLARVTVTAVGLATGAVDTLGLATGDVATLGPAMVTVATLGLAMGDVATRATSAVTVSSRTPWLPSCRISRRADWLIFHV